MKGKLRLCRAMSVFLLCAVFGMALVSCEQVQSFLGIGGDKKKDDDSDTATGVIADGAITFTFNVGGSGSSSLPSRNSVIGPDANIILSGESKAINMYQLIALDATDDESRLLIADFDEAMIEDMSEETLTLSMAAKSNTPYYILLLGGHKNWTAISGGGPVYDEEPPTLLTAGFTDAPVVAAFSAENPEKTVSVTMWPIVVKTEFVGQGGVKAPFAGSTPTVALLTYGKRPWNAVFSVDSLSTFPLSFAENIIDGTSDYYGGSAPLTFSGASGTYTKSGGTREDIAFTPGPTMSVFGSTVTLALMSEDGGGFALGDTGSVAFNLVYNPYGVASFGKTGPWKNKDNFTTVPASLPTWLIRNGYNDEAQNADTDFSDAADLTKNQNGGVNIRIVRATASHTITTDAATGALDITQALPVPVTAGEAVHSFDAAAVTQNGVPAAGFTVSIEWYNGPFAEIGNVCNVIPYYFDPRTVYTARVTLTPLPDWTFKTDSPARLLHTGSASGSTPIENNAPPATPGMAEPVVFDVTFPQTGLTPQPSEPPYAPGV